jgi:hypothetical protein
MRSFAPDYFAINWGTFVTYISFDKIYYVSLDVNMKNA